MHFIDRLALDGNLRRSDGFAVATAKVARANNVQLYTGKEVGREDLDVARIYRPEAEVFDRDSIDSYARRPITIGHPDGGVSEDTWKQHAVGEIDRDVVRDGEFVTVPLILRDAAAIKTVEDGRRELSMGYDAELVWQDGETPSGETYDAIQTKLRMNHVAIVDVARGGAELRIGDGAARWGAAPITTADEKEPGMPDNLRKVLVDGLQVETTDAGAQAIDKLQKGVNDANKKLADTQAEHADAIKAKDAEIAKKDAEIDDLKKKVVDEAALDKRVADRADLIDRAKAVAKDVKVEGLSDAAIRKAAVAARLGDEAVKDRSEAYIDARFDILAEDAAKDGKAGDPLRTALGDGVKSHDGGAWGDAAFKNAGVPMKKEA